MASPTQPQVFDEAWTDERVKTYLDLLPEAGESADFHVLLKAYQGMRVEDFERFLVYFAQAKRDVNALDRHGETILALVRRHRHGKNYADSLIEAGAKQEGT